MKKVYTILCLSIALFSIQATAQVSGGLGGGLLRSTEDNAESMLGFELYVKYDVTDAFRAGINFGYYQKTDEVFGVTFRSSLVPISITGEYVFLENNFRPYVGLQLGVLQAGFKSGNTKTSDSYFAFAPVVGADYHINDQIGLNFNFKYGFAFYKNDLTDELDNFKTISPNIGIFYKF